MWGMFDKVMNTNIFLSHGYFVAQLYLFLHETELPLSGSVTCFCRSGRPGHVAPLCPTVIILFVGNTHLSLICFTRVQELFLYLSTVTDHLSYIWGSEHTSPETGIFYTVTDHPSVIYLGVRTHKLSPQWPAYFTSPYTHQKSIPCPPFSALW